MPVLKTFTLLLGLWIRHGLVCLFKFDLKLILYFCTRSYFLFLLFHDSQITFWHDGLVFEYSLHMKQFLHKKVLYFISVTNGINMVKNSSKYVIIIQGNHKYLEVSSVNTSFARLNVVMETKYNKILSRYAFQFYLFL